MPIYTTERVTPLPTEVPPEETSMVQLVEDLCEEGRQARITRTSSGYTLEEVWERNGQLYVGDHWGTARSASPTEEGGEVRRAEAGGISRFTINRTQQAIIAQRAIAFERPEQFRFTPVERGDDPVVFLRPEFGRGLIGAVEAGQIDLEAEGLAGLTSAQLAGEAPIPETVASGLFPPEAVIRVTDDTVARAVQRVWDTLYRRSGAAQIIATNELYSSIFGHQPLLFQWDAGENLPRFSNPHILNVLIDPTAEDVREAEYVILTTLISLDQAKALWPRLAEDLDRAAASGELDDVESFNVGGAPRVQFRRKMVVVRVAWIRHQEVPVPVEEAVASRRVILATPRDGDTGPGEFEEILPTSWELIDGQPVVTLEDGSRVQARFVRPDTGGETRPGRRNWPSERGIRQVHVLPQIGRVVQNIRCPYLDIPVGWNRNIPVPYSPYGQGEPERLEDLQQAINRLFTILHRHARYYQAPMEFWPEDLYQDVVAKGFSPYSRPGRIIPVRQDIYQLMVQLGGSRGFGVVNAIPPIPSFYVQLLTILLQEFDRLSGFTDVLQGAPPSPETSGRAIEALQAAARGPIGVRTVQTEWMLEYIGRIGLDAIRKWLPESVWAAILGEYPLPVLRHIRQRIEDSQFDVSVSLVSGRGVNEQVDFERASLLYMGGSPARLIPRRRAMELAGVQDIEGAIRQIEQENREGFAGVPPDQREAG